MIEYHETIEKDIDITDIMVIHTIMHKSAKMYVIGNGNEFILFDCLWQDSFPVIKRCLKELQISFSQIIGMFVSHFHPDHAGAFEYLRQHGIAPLVLERQMPYAEWLNNFFQKKKNDPDKKYLPINVESLIATTPQKTKTVINSLGFSGTIIYTPGHSEDSISLIAGSAAFVGDLQPLETADIQGDKVAKCWQEITSHNISEIYYAHGNIPKILGVMAHFKGGLV